MNRPLALGWAVFALAYFSLGFSPGVVRSDDFGYLHSVLGTLERGRPYVHDWLQPFGTLFSAACALLYLATGNFLLATWGFQAACVLALYPLLYLLIAPRLAKGHAALLALALASLPIFFAKEADLHAGICTLDLFLLSLILHEKGRPGWFFFTAFLAFSNRQNHVVLLLLPAWSAAESLRSRAFSKAAVARGAGALAFIGAAAWLSFSMNRTYATIHAGFLNAPPLKLIGDAALALVACVYLALGWLGAFSALTGRRAGGGGGTRRWIPPLAASLGLLAFLPFWRQTLLQTDTSMFGFAGWPQVNRVVPWLILPALWLVDYRLLRPSRLSHPSRPSPLPLLCAGYIGLIALRGTVWDYYFMEISVLCLLTALGPRRPDPGITEVTSDPAFRHAGGAGPVLAPAALAALAVVLAVNLSYACLLKVQSDKQAVAVRVFERLDREGRVTVDAMTGSTFGYLGWKLFDWFIVNDGREFGELAGFMGYVRRDRVVLETGLPWRAAFKGPLPSGAMLLDSGWCRVGFARVRYRVVDARGPDSTRAVMGRTLALDNTRFRAPRFPLDGREWNALADSALGRR